MKEIASDLYDYLMTNITGASFEDFAKRVFMAQFGDKFTPLGGIHDGGADGVLSSYIENIEGKPNSFIQFSRQDADTAATKVKQTIAALRKAERNPQLLIYATSENLPKSDVLVSQIFEKEHILLQIRDRERIKSYLNSNAATNSVFFSFFSNEINRLSSAADLKLSAVTEFAKDPTVYVFLNHELRDRFTKDKLNTRVLDALIYWALRETDPDKYLFMSRDEISAAIAQAFPAAKNMLLPQLDDRLGFLSKREAGGERLRNYRKEGKFCLPFEVRTELADDASKAVLLQQRFQESISARLADSATNINFSDKQMDLCRTLVFDTVHQYFSEQGLLLAAFLEGKLSAIQISDQIVEDTLAASYAGTKSKVPLSPNHFGACMAALRGIFYRSSEQERAYMRYLSRTSCLLVTMQSAPKLLEYLNKMGGNFRLIVGTDILIKALSEFYLDEEYRQVTNLIKAVRLMGSDLILTEPVVTDVFTHLHASDLEFRNHYSAREQYLKDEDVSACDRILIRSYLYAKKGGKGPTNWRSYVHQFVDPDDLRSKNESGRSALQAFLQMRFRMTPLSTEELESAVDLEKVSDLAARLNDARVKHEDLSYNDALLSHAVYSQRKRNKESATYDGFGFRTWWLTKETRVTSLTGALVQAQGGVPYIMRPEFLLNFVSLAPKAADARKSLGKLLPTTAGLQLGHHLSSVEVEKLLTDIADWDNLTPERVSVLMSQKINHLTHTRFKQYLHAI